MNHKRLAGLAAALCLSLVAVAAAFAAPATDKALLQGAWKVVQGVYSDGSIEKELDMGFTFTETSLTNPMDGGALAYSIDEKARKISASGKDSSIVIVYKVIDKKTVEFVEMTVTAKGKSNAIVGVGGMFSSLRLAKS